LVSLLPEFSPADETAALQRKNDSSHSPLTETAKCYTYASWSLRLVSATRGKIAPTGGLGFHWFASRFLLAITPRLRYIPRRVSSAR